MKRKKKFYPLLIFSIIILILLFLAYLYKDYLPKIIPEQPKEKNLEECIKEKNITLYGFSDYKTTKEQIKELEETFNYINFIDCSKNNDRCSGIIVTPAWKVNDKIYFNFFSKGTLIKITGCESVQDKN